MKTVKIVIFGTGDYYKERKDDFKPEIKITALLDNDVKKQGTQMDGIDIISPEEIHTIEYDYVCLMSMYHIEMKEQLLKYQVPEEKILLYTQAARLMTESNMDQYMPLYGCDHNVLLFSWNLGYFGANIALFDMAKIIQKCGYHVYLISMKSGELEKDYKRHGITVIIEPYISIQNTSLMNFVKNMDFIIVNTAWYAFIINDFCRNIHNNILWWIHDSKYVGCYIFNKNISIGNYPNLYIYSVGFVAEKDFLDVFPVKAKVNHLLYGIDDAYNDILDLAKDHINIAMIGSIEWLKGQDLLLDAFLLLPESEQNAFHVWIIGAGSGAFLEEIKQRADNIPQVTYLDAVSHSEILDFYKQIDIVVSASRSDSMPIVIAEGMMEAKVCIISDVIGTAAYIKDGINGLVFKAGEAQDLSKKLQWVLKNRKNLESMGFEARNCYKEIFAMDVFECNIKKILTELL